MIYIYIYIFVYLKSFTIIFPSNNTTQKWLTHDPLPTAEVTPACNSPVPQLGGLWQPRLTMPEAPLMKELSPVFMPLSTHFFLGFMGWWTWMNHYGWYGKPNATISQVITHLSGLYWCFINHPQMIGFMIFCWLAHIADDLYFEYNFRSLNIHANLVYKYTNMGDTTGY